MAHQFEAGDRVRKIKSTCGSASFDKIYTIRECNYPGCKDALIIGDEPLHNSGCHCQREWQLVEEKLTNNQNNNMNKLKTLFTRLVSPDIAKLSEAGFLNGDLALTNEAKEELMNILFLEKRAELLKLAEEILEKRKEECK